MLRYFRDFCFSSLGRAAYCELGSHCILSAVCWIGKVLSWASIWNSNSLSSREKVMDVGDLEHEGGGTSKVGLPSTLILIL